MPAVEGHAGFELPPGPLLGVWAHPDDETYLSAGLMAAMVRRGERVVCVTATRGEEGTWDPERWPPATLGSVREAELAACMEVLGVSEHRWLDHRDGTCADVPFDEGVARIREVLEEVRPRTVLTFGPDGMTGHLDHKAVSAWTSAAFDLAGAAGGTLLYATVTPEWAERFAPRFEPFHVFMEPGTPPLADPTGDGALYFDLPADLRRLKLEAIAKHESQVEGMLKAFGADFFQEAHGAEFFRPSRPDERAEAGRRPLTGWRPDPAAS